MWSLQYESKASKHEPKASAFCEPKTSTATTRGQKAHLAFGAHHIFCNISIVFRVFFIKNEAMGSGQKKFFLLSAVPGRAKKSFSCPPVYKRSLSARIIGQKNAKNVLV